MKDLTGKERLIMEEKFFQTWFKAYHAYGRYIEMYRVKEDDPMVWKVHLYMPVCFTSIPIF